MNNISIIPIKNLPEFEPKHDLSNEIVKSFRSNNFVLDDKDIIVITQRMLLVHLLKIKLLKALQKKILKILVIRVT